MIPNLLVKYRQLMALGQYYYRLAASCREDRRNPSHSIMYIQSMLASGRAYMAARAVRDGYPS